MTREEAQTAWEKIVETGFSNYHLLTPEQKVWFNVEPLTTDGIIDHYINSGAEHNQDTIYGLEKLGFHDVAVLLKKVNGLFKDGQPPHDINERNDEICTLNDNDSALLNSIDDQFWMRCSKLDEALLEFINLTGIGRSF